MVAGPGPSIYMLHAVPELVSSHFTAVTEDLVESGFQKVQYV